jgi:hypothetical protein
MAIDLRGWSIWCRERAADYRRGAGRTAGRRSNNLSDLAAHYEAQAEAPRDAFAGNKPSARQGERRPPSKDGGGSA